jgi:hypothetical protein
MSTDPADRGVEPGTPEPRPLEPPQYVDPVERSIREAIARGEFDHLPGAGKPLTDLGRQYDPDWWARRYVDAARAQDAADEVRRTVRKELPFLRTASDRDAAAARVAELNGRITEVNRALAPEDRIPPIAL